MARGARAESRSRLAPGVPHSPIIPTGMATYLFDGIILLKSHCVLYTSLCPGEKMKPVTWALAFLMFAGVPMAAKRTTDPKQSARQSSRTEKKSAGDAVVPACKDLDSLREEMDDYFDPILAAIGGRQWTDIPSDAPDLTWDTLVDCANQAKSQAQREKALRVLAMWEKIRADNFRKRYLAAPAQPILAPACENLDQFITRVEQITRTFPTGTENDLPGYDLNGLILNALVECANDSNELNKDRAISPEQVKASGAIAKLQLWEQARQIAAWRTAYRSLTEQAKKDNGPVISSEQNTAFVKGCDQIITVAGLTPNGLALYVPPEGGRFMAKNAKNYPRMCLVEDTNAASFAPSVPHYLLVWAYSENAFAGFQPVQQVTTSPISGSGTLTNLYGERWNFTFNGNLTEIDTVEAPYVLQSRSLYLWAYDGKGNVVSRHSITTSSRAGGDASYAVGYNAGALISLLWNNPSHLIKSVLKDVQNASRH